MKYNSKAPGRASKLNGSDLKLLEEAYLDLIPRFALLNSEYTKALMRAANARAKSTFPSRADWLPPLPLRGTDAAQYLMGPDAEVLLHNKISITDSHTHRSITFSSSKTSAHVSRHSSSFVHLQDHSFAQIILLFTHTFVGHKYDMALLQIFRNPVKDIDTNLYYIDNVNLDAETNTYYTVDHAFEHKIVIISSLSAPHVVAYDDGKLWYISYTD